MNHSIIIIVVGAVNQVIDSIYFEMDELTVSEQVLALALDEPNFEQEHIDFEHQHFTIHQVSKSNKF